MRLNSPPTVPARPPRALSSATSNSSAAPATTPVFGNQQQPWSAQVQASQLLYQGGRVRSGVRAAELSSQIAGLDFQRIVADTILNVRTDFYQILLNQALVEV